MHSVAAQDISLTSGKNGQNTAVDRDQRPKTSPVRQMKILEWGAGIHVRDRRRCCGSNIVNVLVEGLKKLFVGRGRHYPIALEGAYKLNQIEASDGIHVMKLPEHYGQLSPILHMRR